MLISFAIFLVIVLSYMFCQKGASEGEQIFTIGNRKVIIGAEGSSIGWRYKDPTPKSQNAKTIVYTFCCVGGDVHFQDILPTFQKHWKQQNGNSIKFVTGNTEPGFDTVATTAWGYPVQLGLIASGVDPIKRGFSYTKWQKTPNKGVVFTSPIVLLVRKGNPKNIRTFADLAKPGVEVIHTNPYSAAEGLWAVYGIYGSALKYSELTTGAQDKDAAFDFLKKQKTMSSFTRQRQLMAQGSLRKVTAMSLLPRNSQS